MEGFFQRHTSLSFKWQLMTCEGLEGVVPFHRGRFPLLPLLWGMWGSSKTRGRGEKILEMGLSIFILWRPGNETQQSAIVLQNRITCYSVPLLHHFVKWFMDRFLQHQDSLWPQMYFVFSANQQLRRWLCQSNVLKHSLLVVWLGACWHVDISI